MQVEGVEGVEGGMVMVGRFKWVLTGGGGGVERNSAGGKIVQVEGIDNKRD